MGADVVGINLTGLREAFLGSEDILVQMLGLFDGQARERLSQLSASLSAGDDETARNALHSLVNICGAVRAYTMSEQSKAVGEAIKSGDREAALANSQSLQREGAFVLRQVESLLKAAAADPKALWAAPMPGPS